MMQDGPTELKYVPQQWKSAPPWRKFLEHFEQYGNVSHAARAAGVTREAVYRKRHTSKLFAMEFDQARAIAVENLEMRAYKRATAEVEPSDRLMELLLKANAPEKYRERAEVLSKVQSVTRVIVELPAEGSAPPMLPPEDALNG